MWASRFIAYRVECPPIIDTMIPEAMLEETEAGLVPASAGCFVLALYRAAVLSAQ